MIDSTISSRTCRTTRNDRLKLSDLTANEVTPLLDETNGQRGCVGEVMTSGSEPDGVLSVKTMMSDATGMPLLLLHRAALELGSLAAVPARVVGASVGQVGDDRWAVDTTEEDN